MKPFRPIPPRSLGWVVVAALAAFPPVGAASAEDADRAWIAGDHARALELYDRLLDVQPDHSEALIRTAKMLSWQSRFEESIARYDRAIAIEPENREARFGRAVTLSWDGKLDRAIDELDRLDAQYPGDRDIRLARARAQSWDGRYKDARAGFQDLLDENPTDVDAQVGLARTHAWAGRTPRARDAYARALEVDPENVDAQVGLGYLELWSGEVGAAASRAGELKQGHPEHEQVAKLHADVSRSAGARWTVDASRLDDTDDNRLRSFLVSGGLGLGRGVRLGLGVGRYDLAGPTGDAEIDSLYATLGGHPARGQRILATVGRDRRTRTDGTTAGDGFGGLSYSWGLERRWQLHSSWMRMPIRYSSEITDNGILFDLFQLRADGAVGERFRVHAGVGVADFSDDNDRLTVDAGFLYRVPLRKVTMHAGYALRVMDYDLDLANGYFDPQDFRAHLAQLRVQDEYGNRGNYYRLHLETGVQSFTDSGIEVTNDTVLILGGTFGFPVAERMTFEAYAEHGDYAAATAAGFESTNVGLRLRWRAGL